MENPRDIPFFIALLPVFFLILFLSLAFFVFDTDMHIPLFTSAMFAALIGMFVLKMPWKEIQEGIIRKIKLIAGAIIILMIIGMLIGSWILSGIVPTMIYYGLQILSPSYFLVATLLICSIVSLATGSSWSTAGTVGVALMGIGQGLGISVPMIGGAIISGAYFADKMSPLSDSTNLTPAMTETDIMDHVRHMVPLAIPSYIVSVLFFLLLGFRFAGNELDNSMIETLNAALQAEFNLSAILLIVPVLVILAVSFKAPTIPTLFGAALLGGIAAAVFQGSNMNEIINSMHYGYTSDSSIEIIADLLTRGGLDNMMWTISLILCAITFGGIMEITGMLNTLVNKILEMVKSVRSLVLTTVITAFGLNVILADHYLSIVITGRMYKDAYAEQDLHPTNLTRAIEGSGTVTSPLIPWNSCGAYMIATLGLAPWTYVPFCIFSIINPFIVILYGFTGISMTRADKNQTQ